MAERPTTETLKALARAAITPLVAFLVALGLWLAPDVGPTDPPPPDDPPTTQGKPTADNTGPTTPEADLTRYTTAQIEAKLASDKVVTGAYVTGGNVDIPTGTQLRDFVIDGGGSLYGIRAINGQRDVVVEDGIIRNVSSTGFYGGGTTLRRVEVYDSGGDAFKPRSRTVIEASYGHHLGTKAGAHADFIQFDGPAGSTIEGVTIRGNNCALGVSTLTAPYKSNACVQVNGKITLSEVEVTRNWFNGGNYTVNCSSPGGGQAVFADNVFGDDHRYGVQTRCERWTGNVYTDGAAA